MTRRLIGLLIMLAAFGFAAVRAPDRSLESLVARWAPPPSEFIELSGPWAEQVVHLRDEGPRDDPQPIVLLHGTSASLHTWEGWVSELKRTRRVVTFDLPAFGLTGPAANGDYSDEAYIAFVQAVLDRLRLSGPVVLGGNSLGGQIAWEFAALHPQRVAALILVDAGGYAFKAESVPEGFQIARMPAVAWLGRYILPRRVIESSLQNVYGQPLRVRPETVDRYFELTLREGNRVALGQRFAQLQPGKYAAQLPKLTQPTLILWGERDHLIPLEYGRQFARDIPGSRLVSFATLGHVPHEEDPAATLVPVLEFLRTLPR